MEAQTQEGVPVRVYTPLGQREQGRFALDVGCRALSFFEQYLAIPYPLPKLDSFALPDFEAHALENFGTITYRETMILVDPEESSATTRQTVVVVVVHELAHQWFGNMTSPSWWRELWLNEGFASWAGNMAVHDLFPDWDMWTQFVAGDFSRGLQEGDEAAPWAIPVGVRAQGSQDTFHVVEEARARLGTNGSVAEWLKLNPDQTGFYRTNYSAVLWERLEAAVAAGELSATDRLGLLNDAFAMAQAGYLETPRALAPAYRQETDYTVWTDLSRNLGACDSLLCGQPGNEALRTYASQLHYADPSTKAGQAIRLVTNEGRAITDVESGRMGLILTLGLTLTASFYIAAGALNQGGAAVASPEVKPARPGRRGQIMESGRLTMREARYSI